MRRLTSDTNTKTFFVDEVILKHNGHRFVTDAIFDTGATRTMIDKSIAETIGLDTTVRLGNYTEIQTADGKLKGLSAQFHYHVSKRQARTSVTRNATRKALNISDLG